MPAAKKDSIEDQFDKMEHCANCRFSQPVDQDTFYCRRYPPKIIDVDEDGGFVCEFPIVSQNDWCGEHKWRPQ